MRASEIDETDAFTGALRHLCNFPRRSTARTPPALSVGGEVARNVARDARQGDRPAERRIAATSSRERSRSAGRDSNAAPDRLDAATGRSQQRRAAAELSGECLSAALGRGKLSAPASCGGCKRTARVIPSERAASSGPAPRAKAENEAKLKRGSPAIMPRTQRNADRSGGHRIIAWNIASNICRCQLGAGHVNASSASVSGLEIRAEARSGPCRKSPTVRITSPSLRLDPRGRRSGCRARAGPAGRAG